MAAKNPKKLNFYQKYAVKTTWSIWLFSQNQDMDFTSLTLCNNVQTSLFRCDKFKMAAKNPKNELFCQKYAIKHSISVWLCSAIEYIDYTFLTYLQRCTKNLFLPCQIQYGGQKPKKIEFFAKIRNKNYLACLIVFSKSRY